MGGWRGGGWWVGGFRKGVWVGLGKGCGGGREGGIDLWMGDFSRVRLLKRVT